MQKQWPRDMKISLKNNLDLFFSGPNCSFDFNKEDPCCSTKHLKKVCKTIPIQIIKLDRLGLSMIKPILGKFMVTKFFPSLYIVDQF